jgi:hypothetical protein
MNNKTIPELLFIFLTISLISCAQKGNSKQDTERNSAKEINKSSTVSQSDSLKSNQLPVIDVTKEYPKKELNFQDIADVSYIPIENKEGHLFFGSIDAYDDDKIIGHNLKGGDIFIFSTDGKIKRVINNMGGGPKEYSKVHGIVYDKQNEELFIHNIRRGRITVYDIHGNFKRVIRRIPNRHYADIIGFNNELIICDNSELNDSNTFFTISKKNGAFIKNIGPSFEKRMTSNIRIQNTENKSSGVMNFYYTKTTHTVNGLILNELSSDTIFKYTINGQLVPIICRTPSVHSTNLPILWAAEAESNEFLFLYGIKKDLKAIRKSDMVQNGGTFDFLKFVYDKSEKRIFTPVIFNNDYVIKKEQGLGTPFSNGISIKRIDAYKLVESYNKGELKGKLKEIASTLKENDNPVLMIMKLKK